MLELSYSGGTIVSYLGQRWCVASSGRDQGQPSALL